MKWEELKDGREKKRLSLRRFYKHGGTDRFWSIRNKRQKQISLHHRLSSIFRFSSWRMLSLDRISIRQPSIILHFYKCPSNWFPPSQPYFHSSNHILFHYKWSSTFADQSQAIVERRRRGSCVTCQWCLTIGWYFTKVGRVEITFHSSRFKHFFFVSDFSLFLKGSFFAFFKDKN